VKVILGILDGIDYLVGEYPPEETKSRFGNVAFRSFYDALTAVISCFDLSLTE